MGVKMENVSMKCKAIKKTGEPCSYKCKKNLEYCGVHSKYFPGVNEGGECPICFDDLIGSTTDGCKSCKYKFHSKCLRKAFNVKPSCPCCRANISKPRRRIPPELARININSYLASRNMSINFTIDELMEQLGNLFHNAN